MKPVLSFTRSPSVACGVTQHATLRADAGELARLRRQPGTWRDATFSPALLKHADDQTVAALAVMLRALGSQMPPERFHDWGVIAAPTLFGRDGTATALNRFRRRGLGHQPAHDPAPHAARGIGDHQPGLSFTGRTSASAADRRPPPRRSCWR